MELLKTYRTEVHWSEADDAFVARVPALPGCAADGPTPADALRELETALEGHLAARAERGMEIPQDPVADRLRRMAPYLKLSAVAKASGIPNSTLRSKLERGTPITPDEASRIEGTLSRVWD